MPRNDIEASDGFLAVAARIQHAMSQVQRCAQDEGWNGLKGDLRLSPLIVDSIVNIQNALLEVRRHERALGTARPELGSVARSLEACATAWMDFLACLLPCNQPIVPFDRGATGS